jgi:hypothetical protein
LVPAAQQEQEAVLRAAIRNTRSCSERCLTPPSSGRPTAHFVCLRSPLMSNVSRHMQSCRANGSAKKRRVVLRESADWRSTVGSRKAELAQALCRAARPAAVGAPIVEAPPEQRPASCRAVRPSAASAPLRMRAQEFGASAKRSKIFSAQGNTRSSPRPCEYAAPALLRSSATAGIGRAAHAGGSVGSIRRMQMSQALCSRNRRAVCEQNTVTANPSIERTPYGTLRVPPVAAHVER